MPDSSRHPALGRTEQAEDVLDPRPARHFQLALDRQPNMGEGDPLPPLWHYFYFNPQIRSCDLASDGHERLGGFLPDLGLPRRMWGGSRITVHAPLRIGERAVKTSTIEDVTEKTGRSGRLGFVTVRHDFTVDGAPRMTDVQTIVYREPTGAAVPPPAEPEPADWQESVTPDEILLFRYSALIFYAHRIHYDADYTREVEGYPALLAHGPLTATLLAGAGQARHPGRRLTGLEIRAQAPCFVGRPLRLEGRGTDLRAVNGEGAVAMRVRLSFDDGEPA